MSSTRSCPISSNPRILVLTGPSAAGKSTVNQELAHLEPRCALIDGDHFRAERGGMTIMPSPGYVELVHRGALPMPTSLSQSAGEAEALTYSSRGQDGVGFALNAWRPSVEAIIAVARGQQAAGRPVSIHEVLSTEAVAFYQAAFGPQATVVLLPSRAELQHRFDERAQHGGLRLPYKALDTFYEQQAQLTGCDLRLDTSALSAAQVAQQLLPLLR